MQVYPHTSYSLQRTQTKPFEEKRKGYTKIRLCGFLHCNSVVAVERARAKLQTEKMARTPKTYIGHIQRINLAASVYIYIYRFGTMYGTVHIASIA